MARRRPPSDTSSEGTTRSGSTDADAPTGAHPNGFTLEELADATGVAPRTIRYYQAERLLQKPDRDRSDGRVVRYDDRHVERLRLVGELRDRGLKLPAIRDLLAEGDTSQRVSDWLGLDDSLRGTWGETEPRILTRNEVNALLEAAPAGTQGQLEDAGLLTRQGHAWIITNPALFDLVLRLVSDGVPPDLVIEAGAILQAKLGRAARELIDLFVTLVNTGYGSGVDPATLVNAFRPAAGDAARLIFEAQLAEQIEHLLSDTKRLGKR